MTSKNIKTQGYVLVIFVPDLFIAIVDDTLQSFTKYIETNASLLTILLSFVKKAIYHSQTGQNVYPPPPTKQCCVQVITFPGNIPTTHINIALSGEGVENQCSLRIFVRDCRSVVPNHSFIAAHY